jgi:hypothetical protein
MLALVAFGNLERFSSEVDPDSREENASTRKLKPPLDVGASALAVQTLRPFAI